MGETSIEWTDMTWNPVTGCTKVSTGCKHCFAERIFPRIYSKAFVDGRARKFTDVQTHPDRISQPLSWKRPRRIFVNSMSDLFHEDLPDEFIDQVFAVMALAKQHKFQVLTKRPERMRDYVTSLGRSVDPLERAARDLGHTFEFAGKSWVSWPIPNVWLGVSVENQETADERLPLLRDTPAAVRMVSFEPLLGRVDLCALLGMWWNQTMDCWEGSRREINVAADGRPIIGWAIVGGESGPEARELHVDWARSLREQCRGARIPFFMKQGSAANWTDYKDFACFPRDLQVREYPA